MKRFVEVLSLCAGLAALAVSIVPGTVETFGETISRRIVAISGATLIASVAIDRILSDPPERFADFAFYLGGYQASVNDILLSENDPNAERRLQEVLRMAENNINDVRSKWPDLFEQAQSNARRSQVTK